jgi:ribosome-binding ATPase
MIVGIVGLPKSGKTTIFNAITGASAQTSAFTTAEEAANVAVVKVPDPRIDTLYTYFKDPKKVFVELKFIDFAPFKKGMGEKGFPAKHLGDLRACDALLLVIRAFENESVPHPEDTVDAVRDLETLLLELVFADLEVIEHRIDRMDQSGRKGAAKEERANNEKEKVLLERIKAELENDGRLDAEKFTPEEKVLVRNYGFLTTKPLICALNIHENDLGTDAIERVKSKLEGKSAELPAIGIAGSIEMDIAQLDESERGAFMSELGIAERGRDKVLRLAWEKLGLIVFFTVGDDECRAWPVRRGDDALTAAGKIHSDIARGFIRAEVYPYSAFIEHGGMAGVKNAGLFRLEGKEYVVNDGDIIHFRFNV